MSQNLNLPKPEIAKNHSRSLSLWHWANLLVMACILITVLLVKTIFSSKSNTPVIQSLLEKKGVQISLETAKAVAKLYSHKLWDWHLYFGYALTALILFRIIIEYFELSEDRLLNRIRKAKASLSSDSQKSGGNLKALIVQIIYLFFYGGVLFMAVSGLFIHFADDYPQLKVVKSTVKDMHNIGMYGILCFIILHLAGLFLNDIKKNKV